MNITQADIDDIRFRFEIAGESVESICASTKIPIVDLTAYIQNEGWVKPALLLPGQATEEQVNDFYKQGRMHLTKHITNRSVVLYSRFVRLEDRIIGALEDTLDMFDSSTPDATHNLSRIVVAYTKLTEKHALLEEAIATPALADKKIENMLKDQALSSLLDKLDGRGRLLPSTDKD